MAHAARSPLFQSLEMLIQEQVGRGRDCPEGAGILRAADPATACRDPASGLAVTGSGGEHWCVNCHLPGENLAPHMPAWDGRAVRSASRLPIRDLVPDAALEGIGCVACHQMAGPVHPGDARAGRYEGNPSWVSSRTGQRFAMRPEDARGRPGIANSGYRLDPRALLAAAGEVLGLVAGGAHRTPPEATRRYLRSSEFCGACHDVRLFGTDTLGAARGEHFKRLRNAYSEWVDWGERELRAGRVPASCQDCHMSLYPGICEPDAGGPGGRGCPPGSRFAARAPGRYPTGFAAAGAAPTRTAPHYFSAVDLPLAPDLDLAEVDDPTLDVFGLPLGARLRRDLLLAAAFRFAVDAPRRFGATLEIPIVLENVGAGHRVPAGFSQEREIWVHLRVTDARGEVVYEVGRVDRPDQDLADKIFLRVNTDPDAVDGAGRPIGLFGADVADGADLPVWDPPAGEGTRFRGRGLINLQNGFLRCVRCIGRIDAAGRCQPLPGQEGRRADRFADGDYDLDSGACRSNLRGAAALYEVYFPVGALDASRGDVRGPDAIADTRSAPPGVPLRYTYALPAGGHSGPYTVEARLLFRAFPPFLLRAFADYEARQDARGRRPSGPLLDQGALGRLDVVELATARAVIP